MTDCIQVMTTVEERAQAEEIAEALLDAQLAACVQVVGPITSYYRWQGKKEQSAEYLCLIKSRRHLYDELEALIRKSHPYEVPEILAVPVVAGSTSYLDWLAHEVREEGK
ncbi:MAG: divalent-cation tolerance protein CutA [Desulfobulbaceae bacterium]|nr:divalent-cation tolerance protein CutA [Desulfobulbaceae bacterium]